MISSTAAYALRAVVFLASKPDVYMSRDTIAEATQVPFDYLLKVLNRLDAAEIVESRRGRDGGYRLRSTPQEITALDVLLSIESIPRISECPLGFLDHERLCPLHQLMDDASRFVQDAFRKTKIADLMPRKLPNSCEFPRQE